MLSLAAARSSRRLIALAALVPLLALAALLALAGCGSSAGREEAAPPGKIVVRFWNGFTGPDGKTMGVMVREFERENPDVVVDMQLIPWSTYYDKLTLSLAYGGAPDLFVLQAARFPEFTSYGVVKPLTALYAASEPPLTAAQFAPVPWRESFYDGVQYALPLDEHPIGLWYNQRLFEQAGIVDARGHALPPATLPEFLADAQRLTKPSTQSGVPDQWGFAFTFQHTNWLTFADQFGGGIVTPDGKRGAMASPPSLQATRLMCDLIYRYHVAPRPDGVDAWPAFQQGRVGMVMEGSYMLSSLQDTPGLQFAAAPVPQFGPEARVWGGSHLLCQPAGIDAAHSRAAWRLMRFLSRHSLLWGDAGQVPARLSVERSPQFQALPAQSQFAREAKEVVYDPQIPKANALNQFADPAIEAALLRLQTPSAAMRDADRRINQLLSRP